jgi:hypothetical protein
MKIKSIPAEPLFKNYKKDKNLKSRISFIQLKLNYEMFLGGFSLSSCP